MKKYVMNKNVMHGGVMYANGKEIRESDSGFAELVKSGHATIMAFADEGQEPVHAVVTETDADEKPVKRKHK